jgi:hypothetical protein
VTIDMRPEEVMPALRRLRAGSEKLYCRDNGRPALAPSLKPTPLAVATILQFMEKAHC